MRPLYSDQALYNQLSYFLHLFDVESAIKKQPEEKREEAENVSIMYRAPFSKLYDHVDRQLQKSARKHVVSG